MFEAMGYTIGMDLHNLPNEQANAVINNFQIFYGGGIGVLSSLGHWNKKKKIENIIIKFYFPFQLTPFSFSFLS